jgi:hypothetical protein
MAGPLKFHPVLLNGRLPKQGLKDPEHFAVDATEPRRRLRSKPVTHPLSALGKAQRSLQVRVDESIVHEPASPEQTLRNMYRGL